MNSTKHEIQRELMWLLDARYLLNPHEFRPAGAKPKTTPAITVRRDIFRYFVTLTWDKVEATSTLVSSEAEELLLNESRRIIDRALQSRFRNQSYVRRPLLIEIEKVVNAQAVLVTPIGSSKLACEPLNVFPWQSNHEFCCTGSEMIALAVHSQKLKIAQS